MAGLLDALGQGLYSISDKGKQDEADARELKNYEAKARLQQDLEEQFYERKQALASKYPEYKKTWSDYGVTFGMDSNGNVKELSRDEEARAALLDTERMKAGYYGAGIPLRGAQADKAGAEAAGVAPRVDNDATRADAARITAEAARKNADTRADPPAKPAKAKPKGYTDAQVATAKKEALERLGSGDAGRGLRKAQNDTEGYNKLVQEILAQNKQLRGEDAEEAATEQAIDYDNLYKDL